MPKKPLLVSDAEEILNSLTRNKDRSFTRKESEEINMQVSEAMQKATRKHIIEQFKAGQIAKETFLD